MKDRLKYSHPIFIATIIVFLLITFWTLESYLTGYGNIFLLMLLVFSIPFVLRATKIAASEKLYYNLYSWIDTYILLILTFLIIYIVSPEKALKQRISLIFTTLLIFVIYHLKNNFDIQSALKKAKEEISKGNFDKAQHIIEYALTFNPDDTEIIIEKARNLIRLKKYEEAMSVFNQFFDKKPGHRTTILKNIDNEKNVLEGISVYLYQILSKQADISLLTEPKFYILEDKNKMDVSAGFEIDYKNIKFEFIIFTKEFIDYLTIKTKLDDKIRQKIKIDNQPNQNIKITDDAISITIKLQNVPIRGNQISGIDENLPIDTYLKKIITTLST